MKLKDNFVRLSMLVFVVCLSGTATVGNAQSKIHISGYGNMHYMDHNGMPVFIGKRDMNNEEPKRIMHRMNVTGVTPECSELQTWFWLMRQPWISTKPLI